MNLFGKTNQPKFQFYETSILIPMFVKTFFCLPGRSLALFCFPAVATILFSSKKDGLLIAKYRISCLVRSMWSGAILYLRPLHVAPPSGAAVSVTMEKIMACSSPEDSEISSCLCCFRLHIFISAAITTFYLRNIRVAY